MPTPSPSTQMATEKILEEISLGMLDRRGAIKRLWGLGLSAASIYVLLGELHEDEQKVHAQTFPKADELAKQLQGQFAELQKVLSSPVVVDALREMEQKTTQDRVEIAKKLAEKLKDPGFLKDQIGLKPVSLAQFRMSMRVFEQTANADAPKVLYSEFKNWREDQGTLCASVGVGLCVSYGTNL